MDVRNCKQCGKLFNYVGKNLCPDCLKSKEDEFIKVRDYIRKNPSAGIAEVSEATETTVKQIRQWVREERLVLTEASATAGINCDGCGRPITTGKLCPACKKQMSQTLSQAYAVKAEAKDNGKPVGFSKENKMRYLSKDNL